MENTSKFLVWDPIVLGLSGFIFLIFGLAVYALISRQKHDDLNMDFSTFPGENPLPVLRISPEGVVLYANRKGKQFLKTMKSGLGMRIPSIFIKHIKNLNENNKSGELEIGFQNRDLLFSLKFITKGNYINSYVTDITHSKIVEEKLINAKEVAEKANNAKSEFLARMSHELRTPMNSILGFGQLLQMNLNNNLDATQKKNVHKILTSGYHLLKLINEILDLSKIESEEMSIILENLAVSPVVEEVVEILDPLTKRKNIQLIIPKFNEGNGYVIADRLRFKQVLINLMSNSIKFNRENGKVTLIPAIDEDGRWSLEIMDTGDGISAENIKNLYIPFNRLSPNPDAIEGTGIGLTITRKLINLMNGELAVESQLGVGSCFMVILPLGKSPNTLPN